MSKVSGLHFKKIQTQISVIVLKNTVFVKCIDLFVKKGHKNSSSIKTAIAKIESQAKNVPISG